MRRLTVLLGALALVTAGCGDSGAPSTTAAPATSAPPASATTTTAAAPASTTTVRAPTTTTTEPFVPAGPGYGGEVVIAVDQLPVSLNPYAPGNDLSATGVVGQLYLAGISEIDGSLQRVPDVLVELPTVGNGGITVNDDGTMTVRYLIRDEARWADGTPISGDDFLFTFEALVAAGGVSFSFDDDPYALAVAGSGVARPKTFEFTMQEPTLLHEEMFRAIIPAHDVAGSDVISDWDDRAWVEAGPFRFAEWVPGESMRFVRNENYWKVNRDTGDPLPYLDAVEVRFIPDTPQLSAAFTRREVDAWEPPGVPWAYDELEEALAQGAIIEARNSVIWEHFNFQFGENNPNEGSLNRYVDFRRAVAHAIDRQALGDLGLWTNSGAPLSSYLDLIAPGVGGAAWDRYPHDPDRARELLAGLCAELERDCAVDPPVVVFSTTSNAEARPRIADELERMLEEVGIEVELDLQDSSLFFGPVLDGGAWDMGMWAWVGLPNSASLVTMAELFDPAAPPPDGQNFYRWGTPAVTAAEEPAFVQGPSLVRDEHTARYTEIVAAMRTTVDVAELHRLAREAEEILADQAVILPLLARGWLLAWWPDEIAGIGSNPTPSGYTWNIEEWYRVDR